MLENSYTVKPPYTEHHRDRKKAFTIRRCSLQRGAFPAKTYFSDSSKAFIIRRCSLQRGAFPAKTYFSDSSKAFIIRRCSLIEVLLYLHHLLFVRIFLLNTNENIVPFRYVIKSLLNIELILT